MNRLGFYIFRQLAGAFIFAGVAVTFVVLFTQSFRMLSLVISNASTMWTFFQLMAMSVPTFLPLVLPLSLGVAVTFVYHKLAVDSELVVMRAAGISPMRQALPALALAGMVAGLCFILTLWLTPMANRSLVALEYHMRDNYAMLLSRPGYFNDITDGLTFYARARDASGALEGILMHDVRDPEKPITIMADRGQVMDDKDGQPQLVIFDGRRQEMNVQTGQMSQLAFDQYVLDINALGSAAPNRLPDPREQTVGELLNPSPVMLERRTTREHLLAELHQRLSTPLLAFSYTLIGLAAILAGAFNRRGMNKRILTAAACVIAVQATTMSLDSAIAHNLWLAAALYLVATAPAFVALGWLNLDRLRCAVQAPAQPAAVPS